MEDNSDVYKNSDSRSEVKEMENPSAVLGNLENINAAADTIVRILNSLNEKNSETTDRECGNVEIVENQNRDFSQEDHKIRENRNMFEENKQFDGTLKKIDDEEIEIIKNPNSQEDHIENENIPERNKQFDGMPEKNVDEEMDVVENENLDYDSHEFKHSHSETYFSQEYHKIRENKNTFEENKQLDGTSKKIDDEEMEIIKNQNSQEDHKIIENENISERNEQLDGIPENTADEEMKDVENQNQDDEYCEFELFQSKIGISQADLNIIERKNIFKAVKQLVRALEKLDDEKMEVIKNQNSEENHKITKNENISERNEQLDGMSEKKTDEEMDNLENQKCDEDANCQTENNISHGNNKVIENKNVFEKSEKLDGMTEKKANEELDIIENQKHGDANCQPENKISQDSNKIMENKSLFVKKEKLDVMTEKKANGEMDIIENLNRDDDANCLSENRNSQENNRIIESEDTILQMKKQLEVSKKSVCEKNDTLSLDEEEFGVILSRIKTEESDPTLETSNESQMIRIKVGAKRKKKVLSSNENLAPKEHDKAIESLTDINLHSKQETGEDSLLEVKKTIKKEIPFEATENNEKEVEIVKETFGINIPLIGKVAFHNNEKPLAGHYDLAIERNKRRAASSKKTDEEIMRLIREEERMSESDKKKKAERERQGTINTACYITNMCEEILRELKNGLRDEKKVLRCLRRFLYSNLSPSCLLYVPHLIHTICFIRGNQKISRILRVAANECYNMCHAMFPIPPGYNFETVYTSEMREFLPDDFEKFVNNPLDYGDADDVLDLIDNDDSSDSAYNSESNSIL